jgi:hypothetical protein
MPARQTEVGLDPTSAREKLQMQIQQPEKKTCEMELYFTHVKYSFFLEIPSTPDHASFVQFPVEIATKISETNHRG